MAKYTLDQLEEDTTSYLRLAIRDGLLDPKDAVTLLKVLTTRQAPEEEELKTEGEVKVELALPCYETIEVEIL